ncbi:GNAT family N-acetyltransferase [Candidatus Protochlamydia amoebophila]|uniref:N-acetyltransferase domain-containing protein n=1 Tax=Protochlamydia amoebophila (strain UWE25) TaxID=264201 RepID=Q6MF90_PARUW|nr:GNAT family N-acetyltransferase [Candidatus Protochlamydia amoebophila]CAF22759.1 unnamed protein product [Candidatus Protochlamydia amoebophila UWE25]
MGLINQSIEQEQLIELRYRFHPNYWGRGLATEAVLAVCQYAFDQLGIKKLISIIDPQNFRSLGVAKRAGWLFGKKQSFMDYLCIFIAWLVDVSSTSTSH